MNDKKELPVYTLHELLEQCEESAELSEEDILWANARPVGRERFWDDAEVDSRQTVAYALKSCNGVYHKFFKSFDIAAAELGNYEKELKMQIVELVEKDL